MSFLRFSQKTPRTGVLSVAFCAYLCSTAFTQRLSCRASPVRNARLPSDSGWPAGCSAPLRSPSLRSIRAAHDGSTLSSDTGGKVSGLRHRPRPFIRLAPPGALIKNRVTRSLNWFASGPDRPAPSIWSGNGAHCAEKPECLFAEKSRTHETKSGSFMAYGLRTPDRVGSFL